MDKLEFLSEHHPTMCNGSLASSRRFKPHPGSSRLRVLLVGQSAPSANETSGQSIFCLNIQRLLERKDVDIQSRKSTCPWIQVPGSVFL